MSKYQVTVKTKTHEMKLDVEINEDQHKYNKSQLYIAAYEAARKIGFNHKDLDVVKVEKLT